MKVEKNNQSGYEFLSIAAHQLRGPISSIRGYASMILDGDYGLVSDEQFQAIKLIFEAADSLNKTVNDFMDTSKMEQGQMRFYLKDFDLNDLVNNVAKELKSTIRPETKFDVHTPATPTMIHADKAKIKHVISNLIDNANKYTESGFIKLSVEKHGAHLARILIKDSGIGISPKIIPTLFEKFTRAENATKVNSTGTGLGLYVVKKMIESHHGKVWVESAGEGKGSQFYIELPCL